MKKHVTLIVDGCGPVYYGTVQEGYNAFLAAYDSDARKAMLYNGVRFLPVFTFDKTAVDKTDAEHDMETERKAQAVSCSCYSGLDPNRPYTGGRFDGGVTR